MNYCNLTIVFFRQNEWPLKGLVFATNTGKSKMVVSDSRNPNTEPWLWVPLALVMVEISAGPPPVRGETQSFYKLEHGDFCHPLTLFTRVGTYGIYQ